MTDDTTSKQVTVLKDLIAGGIAGSCSVIVGHPFDTYKVMLQTSAHSAPKKSLTISKLYRGMIPPLASAGVVNALIFSSFGESSRLWDDYFYPEKGEVKLVRSAWMNLLFNAFHARWLSTISFIGGTIIVILPITNIPILFSSLLIHIRHVAKKKAWTWMWTC